MMRGNYGDGVAHSRLERQESEGAPQVGSDRWVSGTLDVPVDAFGDPFTPPVFRVNALTPKWRHDEKRSEKIACSFLRPVFPL